jgi:hypothetical protein
VKELAFSPDRTFFDDFIGRIDQIKALAEENVYFYVPNKKLVFCQSEMSLSGDYY